MHICVFSLKVSNVFYILPDSGQNPRNIQFSLAGAIIESYKVSSVSTLLLKPENEQKHF